MRAAHLVCMLAMAAAAGGLGAQSRMYKSVGPDGRVTWTDKPPTADEASASRRTPAAAGPATQPGADGVPPLADPASIEAFEAARVGPTSKDPAAERAARNVMLRAEVVVHTLQTCGMDLPEQRRKYASAMDAWQARHRAAVERAFAVAGDMLGADARMRLRHAMLQEVDRSLAGYRRAGAAQKLRWCEHQWQQVEGGSLDRPQAADAATLRLLRAAGR